jgi:hypothetical protein
MEVFGGGKLACVDDNGVVGLAMFALGIDVEPDVAAVAAGVREVDTAGTLGAEVVGVNDGLLGRG